MEYHYLLQQVDRLTNTQREQKQIIAQLVGRLNFLENRINEKQLNHSQQQFAVSASNQEQTLNADIWSNGNATPSMGYSLAPDFAAAANNGIGSTLNTPNIANLSHSQNRSISHRNHGFAVSAVSASNQEQSMNVDIW